MTDSTDRLDGLIGWLWSTSPPYVLTVAMVVAAAMLGLGLLSSAVRGVPVLGPPRCVRCGQRVARAEAARCGECGAPLDAGGVVFGQRQVAWWRAVVGLACLGAATWIAVAVPLRAEAFLDRALLRAALVAGCRGPWVLWGAARSIEERAGGPATEEALTVELLSVLGPDPRARLRFSPALQVAWARLGQQCIDRGTMECAEQLAEAGLAPPTIHVRRRWRVGERPWLEIDPGLASAVGGPNMLPTVLCDELSFAGHRGDCHLDAMNRTIVVLARPGGGDGESWPAGTVGPFVVRWRQVVSQSASAQRTATPSVGSGFDLLRAGTAWQRSGSAEATLEWVGPADPVQVPTTAPEDHPWPGDATRRLRRLELRDIDERMLVTCTIRRRATPEVAVAGRWLAVQDDISRPLHMEHPWPCSSWKGPPDAYFDVAGVALIHPRLDPERPFVLVFEPDAEAAGESSADRCWAGRTEIRIEPPAILRRPGLSDPTWWMKRTDS